MSTHTAIAATSKGNFDAIQVPTEAPGEGEILIKVSYAAVAPYDLYVVDRGLYVASYPWMLGFNAAGTVERVGNNVFDLKVGDKVAAMGLNAGMASSRSLQEYCIQSRTVVAKIPDSFPLEKAATIPDNFITVFYAFFSQLGLPIPLKFPDIDPPLSTMPILVYGAGATTGQYAIQLLHLAGYKNIIAIASQTHHGYLRSLGATHVFDYRTPTLVDDISKAIDADKEIPLALNCIGTVSTLKILSAIMKGPSKLGILLPIKEGSKIAGDVDEAMYSEIPKDRATFSEGVQVVYISGHLCSQDEYIANRLVPGVLQPLLQQGYIEGNKVHLLDEGSLKDRVAAALDLHKQNRTNGRKTIVKIN